MIREIVVDNFRSLVGFRLPLKPGVNALVGPNGSGKTNIISFFEFLSLLPNNELANAVSSCGGVGSIFRKSGEEDYSHVMSFSVGGSVQIDQRRHLAYRYTAEIAVSEEAESVYYSKQSICIRKRTVETADEREIRGEWDLEVHVNYDESLKVSVAIPHHNKKKIRWRLGQKTSAGDETFKSQIQDLVGFDQSILQIVRFFDFGAYSILRDIHSAKYYNIIPSRISLPEDGSSEPIIRKDGSGIAATLYAVKRAMRAKGRRSTIPSYYFQPNRINFDPEKISLEKIAEYARLANKAIRNIDVENNPFDNQLIVKITLNDPPNECVLPLSAMSDGTLKWIAFITLLLSRRTIFAVEEPENFLHPAMQTELVELMRNLIGPNNQILMSTHSESILNALKPDEIIVVANEDGRTSATWPMTAKSIAAEITRTGFGLGYFYVAGSLEQ